MIERNGYALTPLSLRLRRLRAVSRSLERIRSLLTALRISDGPLDVFHEMDWRSPLALATGPRNQADGLGKSRSTPQTAKFLWNGERAMVRTRPSSSVGERVETISTPRSHRNVLANNLFYPMANARSRTQRVVAASTSEPGAVPKRLVQLSIEGRNAALWRHWTDRATHSANHVLSNTIATVRTAKHAAAPFEPNSTFSSIKGSRLAMLNLPRPLSLARPLAAEADPGSVRGRTDFQSEDFDSVRINEMRAGSLRATGTAASMSSRARGMEPKHSGPAVLINSTPTVVIHIDNSNDIEKLVLEALRRHREMLFEQWQREAQRRQRTEF